ncbi:unnamed protein product [Mytilus edulis]|uniref:Ubiquitin-like protease family profile domain-containing protein n=1 Tax=Mytilus edulis TaxID=6550 RepID=A0A8S3RPF9_MYTED|nr:unnamed protein product [Mytilus edulis]
MKDECQQDSTACRDNTVENSSSKARNLCLDNIKQITSNLFCINNSQYLEELNNRLAVLVKETEMEAPHQNGLRLSLPATKKKTISRKQKNRLQQKKSNFTRRLTKRSASIKKSAIYAKTTLEKILTPTDGRIQFYNPMGFEAPVAYQVQRNWSDYLAYRTHLFAEKTIEWKLYVEKHALQLDGYNCGVYCLMFAERILSKKELTGITQIEVQEKRKEIAETLLLYEVYMKDACPCCGFNVQEQPFIGCLICGRHFHKLPFCVGESLAKEDANFFTCKMCENNIIPDTIDLGGILEEKPVKDSINPDQYCEPKPEMKKTFTGTTALFVKNLIESVRQIIWTTSISNITV